ncbi:MAG: hypothetical protein R2729_12550 [Bryobacteraceae bacterium]
MGQVPKRVLAAILALAAPAASRRFFPDDPIAHAPAPLPAASVRPAAIDEFTDFLTQSANPRQRPPTPSLAADTLGNVPDSAWFTNRHERRRMSLDELRRGPGGATPPRPPYLVRSIRRDGRTARLEVRDIAGRVFFLKTDPAQYPELATAADVIGSRFFHAMGYHVPENYLVNVARAQLKPAPDATVPAGGRRRRPMTQTDLDSLLDIAPRQRDSSYRIMASLRLPGTLAGPFAFSGTRRDDPNDFVPHERRRDLRGLHVPAAWLNYTDAAAPNTLDTLVEDNGVPFLRHYLLDFDSTLGSDRDQPKDARYGNAFSVPPARDILLRMFTFGLYWEPWERTTYRTGSSIGRFGSEAFDPERWVTAYPNPAFLSRLPTDEYWGAKLVLSFREDEIRAIVEAGAHSDPRDTAYIVQALCQRRLRIGETYLNKVLALDDFHIDNGRLVFRDVREAYGFGPARQFDFRWSEFDNETETHTEIPAARSAALPESSSEYLAARIQAAGDLTKSVTVYVHRRSHIAGVERTW